MKGEICENVCAKVFGQGSRVKKLFPSPCAGWIWKCCPHTNLFRLLDRPNGLWGSYSIHFSYHREIKLFHQMYTNANKFDLGTMAAACIIGCESCAGSWRWQFSRNAARGQPSKNKSKIYVKRLNYTRCVQSNGIVSDKWAGSAAGWRARHTHTHIMHLGKRRRRSSMSPARQLSNLRNKRPPLGLRESGEKSAQISPPCISSHATHSN